MQSIAEELKAVLDNEPTYRLKQIEKAWFDVSLNGYEEITTLPLELREKLKDIPWLSLEVHTELKSKLDNTRKYLFKLADGNLIEMVLMGRKNLKRDQLLFRASREESLVQSSTMKQWNNEVTEVSQRSLATPRVTDSDTNDRYTICVSSQAGCPMRCMFCATGKAGFKRQLNAEEIIDQYRFAQRVLAKEGNRVNNIVMMGQGEPLLNYQNVKRAVKVILANSDLGETKITISTAGVPAVMEQLLKDDDFPSVRWALSLHSAIEETRKLIMPSNKKGFLEWLVKWSEDYHKRYPTRTHFLGFEYIMLSGVNDDEKHLKALIKLCKKIPYFRVNLIPYNKIDDPASAEPVMEVPGFRTFERTPPELIEHWHDELMKAGFTSTIRYSQGQDIAAACGQLRNKVE